jgi:hypothetical protein
VFIISGDPYIVDVGEGGVSVFSGPEARQALECNALDVRCKVSCDKDSFLKVYKGEVKAHHALMTRKIVVHGLLGIRELQKFVAAFDFSSENWVRYYAWKAKREQQDEEVEDNDLREILETLGEQRWRLFKTRFLGDGQEQSWYSFENAKTSSISVLRGLPFGISSFLNQMRVLDSLDFPNHRVSKIFASTRRWTPELYHPIHQDLAEQLALNVFRYTKPISRNQFRFDFSDFQDPSFGIYSLRRVSEAFIRRKVMPFLAWYSRTLDPSDVSME